MTSAVEVPHWTIHTDVFEGPLDLLLYLVQREGICLRTLPVAQIADAYLQYIGQLRVLNLSVASDYLVMAATLVHLKSLELLPRLPTPIDEDAEDPRAEFRRKLRDYQRYKEAAQELYERPLLNRDQFQRPVREGEAPGIATPFDAFGLLDVYRSLLENRARQEPQVEFVVDPGPNIGGCAADLLRALQSVESADLRALLSRLPSRAARVVTFIATLEMLRHGWLKVVQRTHLGEITICAMVAWEEVDMRALTGWVEEL